MALRKASNRVQWIHTASVGSIRQDLYQRYQIYCFAPDERTGTKEEYIYNIE